MGERWKQAMDSWQQELGAGSEETSGMCACCLQVLCTAPALYPTSDDMASIQTSVTTLRKHFPEVIFHGYENMGHFCLDDIGT